MRHFASTITDSLGLLVVALALSGCAAEEDTFARILDNVRLNGSSPTSSDAAAGREDTPASETTADSAGPASEDAPPGAGDGPGGDGGSIPLDDAADADRDAEAAADGTTDSGPADDATDAGAADGAGRGYFTIFPWLPRLFPR